MAGDPAKPGNETSEWTGYMRAIAAIVLSVASGMAAMPFIQNSQVALGIITVIGVISAAIAGMQWKYVDGRSTVKAMQLASEKKDTATTDPSRRWWLCMLLTCTSRYQPERNSWAMLSLLIGRFSPFSLLTELSEFKPTIKTSPCALASIKYST